MYCSISNRMCDKYKVKRGNALFVNTSVNKGCYSRKKHKEKVRVWFFIGYDSKKVTYF